MPTMDHDASQALSDLALSVRDLAPVDEMRNLLHAHDAVTVMLRESARALAHEESWQAVATLAGTSRQAAWERWH